MRIIPKTSKVKMTFYKNVTLADIIIGFVGLLLIAITISTNFTFRFYLCIAILCIFIPLFIPITDEKLYVHICYLFKYLFSKKTFYKESTKSNDDIETITPYETIKDNLIYNKDQTMLGVINVSPIDFNMLNDDMQNLYIENVLGRVLNNIDVVEEMFIVKLDQPLILDNNLSDELERIDSLVDSYEGKSLTKEEYESRLNIIESRIEYIDNLNSSEYMYSNYYLCLLGSSEAEINNKLSRAELIFKNNGIYTHRLKDLELAAFIKYNHDSHFDEREITDSSLLLPDEIKFCATKSIINNKWVSQLVITNYPIYVPNGWGERLFDIEDTKVVMRLKPIAKDKAIKRIDNAIMELKTKPQRGKESEKLDSNMHLESLENLLYSIKGSNETLFDTTIYISIYDEIGTYKNKKKVKTALREMGFSYNEMIGRQMDFYLSSGLSHLERTKISTGIETNVVSASFPFVSNQIVDTNGIYIGRNNLPVFIDFFKRNSEYVNSNTIIIGQSGSGKSYATKNILAGLSTLDTKIYILDPENEYGSLAKRLGGKSIDVSNGNLGKINPFQIIETLEDDDINNSYYQHLQFLEQFYKQILVGISFDALELLNKLTADLYNRFNINANTKISNLNNSDYPIFEDLYKLIEERLNEATDDYNISCLRVLVNYIHKFITGGRMSTLWNGYTTFKPGEGIIAFNFQKLLANKNNSTANAQMLLILKWIENEVIKNRDYNIKNKSDKKIVIAIDEAHLFIDEKYPIALDFMYSLCKRIRKYNGMMIIITQSLKDFTGTNELIRKSMAIINVSQYSLIFNLSPSDMTDLHKLYENAGGINESEDRTIIHNLRGHCLFMSTNQKRTNIRVEATDYVKEIIEN